MAKLARPEGVHEHWCWWDEDEKPISCELFAQAKAFLQDTCGLSPQRVRRERLARLSYDYEHVSLSWDESGFVDLQASSPEGNDLVRQVTAYLERWRSAH